MENRRTLWVSLAIAVLAGFIIAGFYWVNYRLSSKAQGGGEQFLIYYTAARAAVVDGGNPYSQEVEQEIVLNTTTWSARPDPDELKVNFPLYAVPFFLPFALIEPYTAARAAWMTFLEAVLVLTAVFGMRLARWRPSPAIMAGYFLLALLGMQAVYPLIQGNAIILSAFFVALAFTAIRAGMDEAGGFLLALAAIKPVAVLPLLIFVMIWAISQRRWRLVVWLPASVILLAAAGIFFIQNWPIQYARLVIAQVKQTWQHNPGAIFAGWWPGWGLKLGQVFSGFAGAILLVEWWSARKAKDFSWFYWTAGITLALSPWLGLPAGPENFVLLTLPLALVFSILEERWKQAGQIALWASLVVLLIVPWLSYLSQKQPVLFGAAPREYLLFLMPFCALIGLYWVRWWTIRPKRTLLDELRARGEI